MKGIKWERQEKQKNTLRAFASRAKYILTLVIGI
jgi:hypothetical protein